MKSTLTKEQREDIANRLRKGHVSREDYEALADFIECLTWCGDRYEYEDTDGTIYTFGSLIPLLDLAKRGMN